MAAIRKDVRRQHAGRARLAPQFGDQLIGRAVVVATRILLVRHDDVANECLNARGDLGRLRSTYSTHLIILSGIPSIPISPVAKVMTTASGDLGLELVELDPRARDHA
jgi:hypothetical protein